MDEERIFLFFPKYFFSVAWSILEGELEGEVEKGRELLRGGEGGKNYVSSSRKSSLLSSRFPICKF